MPSRWRQRLLTQSNFMPLSHFDFVFSSNSDFFFIIECAELLFCYLISPFFAFNYHAPIPFIIIIIIIIILNFIFFHHGVSMQCLFFIVLAFNQNFMPPFHMDFLFMNINSNFSLLGHMQIKTIPFVLFHHLCHWLIFNPHFIPPFHILITR